MPSSLRRLLALTLLAALSGLGCSTPADPSITGALATGDVTDEGGDSAGVAVRAYGVAPDGTLTPASDTGTTSADGEYSLRVTLDESATRLLVRVQDGTERMTSLGRASLGAVDSTATHITLAPIDARSGFSTNVALTLEAMESVSLEESAVGTLFLSPSASAHLAGSVDQPATINAAAAAVASARATFLHALSPSVSGGGDLQLALSAIAVNEATLAAQLDGADGAAAVSAAYAAYLDAAIAAMFDAGYSREAIVLASLSMESALDAEIGDRMSPGRSELRALGTFAVTSAADAGVGASFESTDVAMASVALRSSVLAMGSAGGTSEAMAAAWVGYADVIATELSARAGLVPSILDMLASDVATATVALEAAWASQGTETTPSARVQAFTSYRASIETTANIEMLTLGGVDAQQADMILSAMGDISAATH